MIQKVEWHNFQHLNMIFTYSGMLIILCIQFLVIAMQVTVVNVICMYVYSNGSYIGIENSQRKV